MTTRDSHRVEFNTLLQDDVDTPSINNTIEQNEASLHEQSSGIGEIGSSESSLTPSADVKNLELRIPTKASDEAVTSTSSWNGDKDYTPVSVALQEEEESGVIGKLDQSAERQVDIDQVVIHDSYQAALEFAQRNERGYTDLRRIMDREDESIEDAGADQELPNPSTEAEAHGTSHDEMSSSSGAHVNIANANADANPNADASTNADANPNDNANANANIEAIDDIYRAILALTRYNTINADNNGANNHNEGNNNGQNDENAQIILFGREFNVAPLQRVFNINRKHAFRDFLIFLYIMAALVVSFVEVDAFCEPSLRVWIIIMGVYLFLRCLLYVACKYLKRRVIEADLAGDHDPFIWSRRLYTFGIRLIELLDVFGVITFCVGNLMVIRAQACYKEAPVSTWSGLVLVVLTNGCLLYPFFKKMCSLCGENENSNDGNEIPPTLRMHLSRSRDDVKRAWTQWLETNGSISFDYSPQAMLDESITEYTYARGDEEAACPICLVDFKSCENVRVQSFPCPSRHIFHEECLLDFLYSVSNRDTSPTCPCCRESAGQRRERSRTGTEEAVFTVNVDEGHDGCGNHEANRDDDNINEDNPNDVEGQRDGPISEIASAVEHTNSVSVIAIDSNEIDDKDSKEDDGGDEVIIDINTETVAAVSTPKVTTTDTDESLPTTNTVTHEEEQRGMQSCEDKDEDGDDAIGKDNVGDV